MKKINQKGFVLAETLVVAVFLMAIFTIIFTNFYPLIGEYEKRESYDDVDGKYAVYWLKRMIEDSSYNLSTNTDQYFKSQGYIRFECKDITNNPEKQNMCRILVKALEVKGCDKDGNHCEIYVTKYRLAGIDKSFKTKVSQNAKPRYAVNNGDRDTYIKTCKESLSSKDDDFKTQTCTREADRKEFRSGFVDYIETLPDYKVGSLEGAKYRVIACFQHKKDNNNYYSYSTIEVNR